jgi:hypothetical protein
MAESIVVKRGNSVAERFRIPKTAQQVLDALGPDRLIDHYGNRLVGSDDLAAGGYTFEPVAFPGSVAVNS